MKRKLYEYVIGGQNFKKEVKRQIRLLIILTLGFTIAFSWRQTLFDSIQFIVDKVLKIENAVTSSVMTSISITIIALILIYFLAHILKERPDY